MEIIMNSIIIEKPYIVSEPEWTSLHATIRTPYKVFDLWYKVQNEYAKYLCVERSDAFLVAVLPLALKNGWDIINEQVVTSKLYHQLTKYLIPSLGKYAKEYCLINVYAPTSNEIISCDYGVGTGISGGVDSFYTILNNLHNKEVGFNLTHLTFFNVGSHGDFGGESASVLFKKRIPLAEENARILGLPLVIVDSNISDLLQMPHLATHTYRTCSAVLALQKLFHIYYFASGHDLLDFGISSENCGFQDLLNVHCLSSDNTLFFLSGIQETRIDKEKSIADNPIVQRRLNVCIMDEYNCSHCEKCYRTMIGLYAIGKLDDFSQVFDVEDFKAHLGKRLGYMLGYISKNKYRESYDEMKKNKIHIPFMAYIYGCPRYCKELVRPLYERL